MQKLEYDDVVRKREARRRYFQFAAAFTPRCESAISITWRKSPALKLRKSAAVRAKKLSIDRPASATLTPRSDGLEIEYEARRRDEEVAGDQRFADAVAVRPFQANIGANGAAAAGQTTR